MTCGTCGRILIRVLEGRGEALVNGCVGGGQAGVRGLRSITLYFDSAPAFARGGLEAFDDVEEGEGGGSGLG